MNVSQQERYHLFKRRCVSSPPVLAVISCSDNAFKFLHASYDLTLAGQMHLACTWGTHQADKDRLYCNILQLAVSNRHVSRAQWGIALPA